MHGTGLDHAVRRITKELNVRFTLGYHQAEFADTPWAIAKSELDAAPMITGEVGLDGIAGAFGDLSHPDRDCKTRRNARSARATALPCAERRCVTRP